MSLIKENVNNLPYLLIYYVPGFCTIFAYRRFRSACSFALVKLRGWRKARQLYADKLKSSLSDTVFEASELADDVYVTVYGEKSECRAD